MISMGFLVRYGDQPGYFTLPEPYLYFHLWANTDSQRGTIFTKGPSDVLDPRRGRNRQFC